MCRGVYTMSLLPHEVFASLKQKRKKADKVQFLKDNENWALKDIIRGSMDPTIEWDLPGGDVPYTPCSAETPPSTILRENTKFAYLVKGGKGKDLPAYKRENIFLGILEGIHPEDAALLVDMINKVTPKNITRPIVEEAFPGLLRG